MKTLRNIPAWLRRNPHCLAALYFVLYVPAFLLLERFSPEQYAVLWHPLDNMIPFCSWFVLPYLSWLLLMPFALLYYLICDGKEFLRLGFIMFTGMTVCLITYAVWPNGLDLRAPLPDGGLLCRMVAVVRAQDTPTNVCPSIHVASSVAIAIVTRRAARFRGRPLLKLGVDLLVLLICASTVFIKQHSVIDVFWGVLLSAGLAVPAYRVRWRNVLQKTPLRVLLGKDPLNSAPYREEKVS